MIAQSLLKKYIFPAAKRIGADLFETAAQEIGEVDIGVEKIQNNCKRCWNKNSSKTIGRWKKTKRRTERTLSRESRSKKVALVKTFLTK